MCDTNWPETFHTPHPPHHHHLPNILSLVWQWVQKDSHHLRPRILLIPRLTSLIQHFASSCCLVSNILWLSIIIHFIRLLLSVSVSISCNDIYLLTPHSLSLSLSLSLCTHGNWQRRWLMMLLLLVYYLLWFYLIFCESIYCIWFFSSSFWLLQSKIFI